MGRSVDRVQRLCVSRFDRGAGSGAFGGRSGAVLSEQLRSTYAIYKHIVYIYIPHPLICTVLFPLLLNSTKTTKSNTNVLTFLFRNIYTYFLSFRQDKILVEDKQIL
jgi:hypothetical protein